MQVPAWSDALEQSKKSSRSAVADPAMQLEERCCGELVELAALSAP